MSKRAAILLIAAFAILLGSLAETFFSGRNRTDRQAFATEVRKVENVQAALATVTEQLRRQQLQPSEYDLVERIHQPWALSPFGSRREDFGGTEREAPKAWRGEPAAELTYDGFIAMGDRLVVFVSGVPQETGDVLADMGMRVHSATRDTVVLQHMDTGETLDLPLNPGSAPVWEVP